MNKKRKSIFKLQIITIGLILGGVGFFLSAKAQETSPQDMPVIWDQPPADLKPPAGMENIKQPPAKSQEIPADLIKEVAFKQVNLMIKDLKMDKVEYSSGDMVEGSFKLKNDSNLYSNGFYYKVTLRRLEPTKEGVTIFKRTNNIDYIQSEIFNVYPQEEKSISFSYEIPNFCPTRSDYIIRVSVFNSRGAELTSSFQNILIKNTAGDTGSVFLDEENSQIFGPDKPYKIQDGTVFEYGQEYNPVMEKDKPNKEVALKNEVQVKIAYSAQNNLKERTTAKVSFYKHGNYLEAIDSKTYPISNDFTKDPSGFLNLTLPLFPDPGTYEAVIQLFVGEEKVSNFLGVRYTTKGDSGLIHDFLVEKNGENSFTFNLLWAGPGDATLVRMNKDSGFVAQVILEAKEEKTQKVCFEKTIDIKPNAELVTQLPFTISGCTAPYQFDARIQKDGKILDQQQISESKSKEAVSDQSAAGSKISTKSIIMIGFAVLTIILLIIVFLKKRSAKPIFMIVFAILLSFGLFGLSKETKAADFHSSSGGYWNYVHNQGLYYYYYKQPSCCPGQNWWTSCDRTNAIDYNTGGYVAKCCPNYGWQMYLITDWWSGQTYCTDGWNYYGAPTEPADPGGWYGVLYGYYQAFNFLLQNYKTTFNQGETMSIYETIVPYPTNCGNNPNYGSGSSTYYVYNAWGGLVWANGYSYGEGYSTTGAGMGIPMVFGPGNYVLYISASKAFYAGEDDPMYRGSDWISLPFTIINPNATLSVGYPSGYGVVAGPGIYCAPYCSTSLPLNSGTYLTAYPSTANSTFAGWGGDCAPYGASPTCYLTMNSSKTVYSTFNCSCSSSDSANHCEGTTYTNSCGASCTGTKPNNPWTPDPSGTCNNSTLTQTSNCGNTRTVPGTMPTLNGQCGSASGKLWDIKPNSDLCSIGTSSDPASSENQWCWNCSGICGGSATECCAQRDSNWKEVAP